ncbi:MAG: FkbM family methyltransferase [Candidatus Azobacteroides sp.]|nr:FkbM family methyltransferase [Candidatus Azobacteroides sp.]
MSQNLIVKRTKITLRTIFGLGPVQGVKVLSKMLFKNTDKVNLPGIKYPISLRPDTTDYDVFYQLFSKSEYDLPIPIDFEPRLIIDAGANIGLTAVYFKNKFPDATIISIEPDNENFEMLKKNTAQYDNVYLEKAGLWNKETYITVKDTYGLGAHGMIVKENDHPVENSLKAVTIDGLLKKYNLTDQRIDILKVDIETSEKHFFASNYESWLPKTKLLIVELHDIIEKGCAQAFFNAICRSLPNFSFHMKGENVIVINEDI